MSYLLIILLFIGVIILFVFNSYVGNRQSNENNEAIKKLSYRKKYYFFNSSERKFFAILENIINSKYIIFSKVRMMDLLEVSKEDPHYRANQNRIKSKHVDFVICDKEKLTPLLVIELDGLSHLRPDRIERDKFVNEAFNSAHLPIVHFQNSDIDKKEKIFSELKTHLISTNE
jgi:hypothetical protein